VDVEDVAAGHLLAASGGRPGERYILGGYNLGWVDLIDRISEVSGIRYPLLVLPRQVSTLARVQDDLGVPSLIASEAFSLMAQNWRYSSRKAKRELGFAARPLVVTLGATIDWYRELIERGAFRGARLSRLSATAFGVRAAERLGVMAGLRFAERQTGRRLVTGT
jgi:dihydroflavonol-4-reductase